MTDEKKTGFKDRCPHCGEAGHEKYTYQGVEMFACPKCPDNEIRRYCLDKKTEGLLRYFEPYDYYKLSLCEPINANAIVHCVSDKMVTFDVISPPHISEHLGIGIKKMCEKIHEVIAPDMTPEQIYNDSPDGSLGHVFEFYQKALMLEQALQKKAHEDGLFKAGWEAKDMNPGLTLEEFLAKVGI